MSFADKISSLKEWLNITPGPYVPTEGGDTYLELDTGKVAKNLKLLQRGCERGKADNPPTDQTNLDSVEQESAALIRAEGVRNRKILDGRLVAFTHRIARLELNQVPQMRNQALSVIGDFRSLVHDGVNTLTRQRRVVIGETETYDNFRRKHKLDRTAAYPENKVFLWAAVVLMLLGESILNGIMLGQGHDYGIIGGVGYAAAIAFVNIMFLGSFMSIALRNVHHANVIRKFVSFVAAIVIFVIAFFVNFMVAHYRDLLGTSIDTAAEIEALNRLITLTPPQAMGSFILLFLGFGFFIAGAYDFLKMDDRYPLFGQTSRKWKECQDDYADLVSQELEELGERRNETTSMMENIMDEVDRRKGEYLAISEHRRLDLTEFSNVTSQLKAAGNHLIQIYRDSNRGCRTTPAPNYFSNEVEFSDLTATDTKDEWDSKRLNELAEETRRELSRGIDEVHEEHNMAVQQYKQIEQLGVSDLSG